MPDERRYRVTGAILTRRGNETVWMLTFTLEAPSELSPETDDEIVIAVPPADVDNMLFDVSYTRDEIEALRTNTRRPDEA
jgi:hypothetical protein